MFFILSAKFMTICFDNLGFKIMKLIIPDDVERCEVLSIVWLFITITTTILLIITYVYLIDIGFTLTAFL